MVVNRAGTYGLGIAGAVLAGVLLLVIVLGPGGSNLPVTGAASAGPSATPAATTPATPAATTPATAGASPTGAPTPLVSPSGAIDSMDTTTFSGYEAYSTRVDFASVAGRRSPVHHT
jgi:hypothetical protein